MKKPLNGLIASAFTHMREDGSINRDMVRPIVDHLVNNKIAGLYVCGSNGEGPSLAIEERMIMAEAYVAASSGRLPVIIQVGHSSLIEAGNLAAHAKIIGADAIAASPPAFFPLRSVELLLECLMKISASAPGLPFFYYHIPQINGVNLDMLEFLRKSAYFIPDLSGIIYRGLWIHEFQACLEFQGGRFNMLFGGDEMLASGLTAGAHGAVGCTFNFAAPLYNRVISAFRAKDLEETRRWQSISITMIRLLTHFRCQPAFKGVMKLIDLDCGPSRLPLETLAPKELDSLKLKLGEIGFFQWATK